MDLVRRFIKDTESFTPKIAAAGVIPVCYPHVNPAAQQDLIMYYGKEHL